MIQVVVAAATLAARAGLRAILGADDQVEVIAEAAALEELQGFSPPVDVYVVLAGKDAHMGWENIPVGGDPPPAALLLVEDTGQAQALVEMPLRAWGLLPPNCTESELLTALFAVAQGLVVGDAAQMADLFSAPDMERPGVKEIETPLTDRELEVLDLLAEGLANKQISLKLGISEHTVKFHVSSIYNKLDVSNRAEAVRLGIQLGLVMV